MHSIPNAYPKEHINTRMHVHTPSELHTGTIKGLLSKLFIDTNPQIKSGVWLKKDKQRKNIQIKVLYDLSVMGSSVWQQGCARRNYRSKHRKSSAHGWEDLCDVMRAHKLTPVQFAVSLITFSTCLCIWACVVCFYHLLHPVLCAFTGLL